MFLAWLLSLSLIGVTVVIHTAGLGALMRRLNTRAIESEGLRHSLSTVMAATVVAIAALHGCEAAVWAVVYRLIGVVPDFETAFYFSFVAFTTLGLGDVTLKPPWRILSAMEAADGMLLFGWSTAFLFAVLQRVWRFSHESDRSLRDVRRKAGR
jgi:Ion channel